MSELALKEYQQRTLDTLAHYFKECLRANDAQTAYHKTTEELFGRAIPYQDVKELPGLPYVCIRIPTGGGKTLVASHAAGVAQREYLGVEHSCVLWLVPSEPIREQTLRALRDRKHPYRRALEMGMGSVSVVDLAEAVELRRTEYEGQTVIIVATIQAFRRESTKDLNVYKQSGSLTDHFADLSDLPEETVRRLERYGETNQPIPSFANVLFLRRPVVIVDEAHNARTGLSFSVLARFNPSCIIEFTATPKIGNAGKDGENPPSNVLHTVCAAELDQEEMIKMPIRLTTRTNWQQMMADAIQTLNYLREEAKKERRETGEHIRPVMLIQAEAKSQQGDTLTADVVKKSLIEDHKIDEKEIAIVMGAKNELGDQDLKAENCPIRFIITVDKLREGWDCPFAYILATVREMKSSTAIEQILGRIMRLPQAKKKKSEKLNIAYAFSTSDLSTALQSLRDSLINIGFEKQEARDIIVPMLKGEMATGDLFSEAEMEHAAIAEQLPAGIDIAKLSPNARQAVTYDVVTCTIAVDAPLEESVVRELEAAGPAENRKAIEKVFVRSQQLLPKKSPVEKGAAFHVPLLCFKQGDLLEPFAEDHFLSHRWDLREKEATFSEQEFGQKAQAGKAGEIDISDQGKLKTRAFAVELHDLLFRQYAERRWSEAKLSDWLDNSFRHRDVSKEEMGVFLLRLLKCLTESRAIPLEELAYRKMELRAAIETKIERYRQEARNEAYQTVILDDGALVVEPEICFSYPNTPYSYGTSNPYKGARAFSKKYYPQVFDLDDKGEEFDCACFLDGLDAVEYWVRNIPKRESSFWLQTSSDRFYPDFVCQLRDGRILVVEHKGEHLYSNDDSKEKRGIGELWALRSKGRCLFVMTRGKDFPKIERAVQG